MVLDTMSSTSTTGSWHSSINFSGATQIAAIPQSGSGLTYKPYVTLGYWGLNAREKFQTHLLWGQSALLCLQWLLELQETWLCAAGQPPVMQAKLAGGEAAQFRKKKGQAYYLLPGRARGRVRGSNIVVPAFLTTSALSLAKSLLGWISVV